MRCYGRHTDYQVPDLDVLLPVGISFYTFQTLSYTIDIYWRESRPEPNLFRFALYVSFQLVALQSNVRKRFPAVAPKTKCQCHDAGEWRTAHFMGTV
ncbi:MAG: hypothetical protein R3A47_03570 [Polyangiales bacterium]